MAASASAAVKGSAEVQQVGQQRRADQHPRYEEADAFEVVGLVAVPVVARIAVVVRSVFLAHGQGIRVDCCTIGRRERCGREDCARPHLTLITY